MSSQDMFTEAQKMLEEASKVTVRKDIHLKLLNTKYLCECKNLSFDVSNLELPFFSFKKDGFNYKIDFDPWGSCCEDISAHLDGVLFYKTYHSWSEMISNMPHDESFSIRILHFTIDKLKCDELDDGGKVVIDIAVGSRFDKSRILHRFVIQNYHTGWYSHCVSVSVVNHPISLSQFYM